MPMVPAQGMTRMHCQCTTLASIELDQLASGARGLGTRGYGWEWGTWRHGLLGEGEWWAWPTAG